MSIQFNPSLPFYFQIKEDILKKIEDGTYKIGDQLPSEYQLIEEYDVSRSTVRQAVTELVQEGILVRGRGRGTFVSQPLITSNAQVFTTFAEAMQDKGVEQQSRLIDLKRISASEKIAKDLKIAVGESVIVIIRLRMGNNEPLVIRTTHIAEKLCPGIEEENLELEPIYSIFKHKYGLVPAGATQTFQAVTASEMESDFLQIDEGSPLMLWKGIIYTAQDVPIERVKAIYRGDRFQFEVQQGRNFQNLFSSSGNGVGILEGIQGGI